MKATTVPRALATIVLLVSLSMLIPLGIAVTRLIRGTPVASAAWAIPLVILATGFALMAFLPKLQATGVNLYLMAFALWILAAGYFLLVF
jgi:hypothetical protein